MKYLNQTIRDDGAVSIQIGPYHEAEAGAIHMIDCLFIHWFSLGEMAVLRIGPWKHLFDHRAPEDR